MSAALQEKPEIKLKLTVVKGPHAGQVFQTGKEVVTLGRGSENTIVLMNDPQVSRTHAQIKVVNGEVEVENLSQKNAVIVDGSSVQKWKLVSNSQFTIGDSEIKIEYDLGHAVVSVPTEKMAEVVPLKQKTKESAKKVAVPAKIKKPQTPKAQSSGNGPVPAVRQQQIMRQQMAQQQMMQARMQQGLPPQQQNYDLNSQFQARQGQPPPNKSLMASPSFKIFLILLIILGVGYSYISKPNKKTQAKKIASTLKYEDEINNRLVSKKEKDLEEDREDQLKQKFSPQSLRVNESFLRGMRDYKAGNYARAQEFFQIVLNLEPDHTLAKRHLYLSKVRFDELVQEKLMLGDSYYKKHNFRMCESMYEQVMNMLVGKNSEQKYMLAEKKAKECNLATQGIR